jgi:N-acetylglucosamine-6-phosphate deacetylase
LADAVWIGARRLFPGGGRPPEADRAVEVAGSRIVSVRPRSEVPPGAAVRDHGIVAPGFVDLQINGGGGLLFNDAPTPATIAEMARAARKGGTAHILPTFITDAGASYVRALEAVEAAIAAGVPGCLGIHLEGPFLSPKRPGIHPPRHIRPLSAADAERIGAARHPCLLTLAPEEADEALLGRLVAAGVTVFAGHSEATAEEIARAADLGLRGVTHLWNAMSQLQGRAPGVVGAALTDGRLAAGIIADGLHVHPLNLRLAAAAMGERLFLVTDAMPTLAAAIDGFALAGVPVRLVDGRLVSPEGTLAGAHLAMDEAVRNMVRLGGVSEALALDMASGRAAAAIGLGGELGRIAPGFRASLACLDAGLRAEAVMVDGRFPDEGPQSGEAVPGRA